MSMQLVHQVFFRQCVRLPLCPYFRSSLRASRLHYFLHTDPGGKQPILAAAPFLFETDVVVDGKRLHEHLDLVTLHSQTLDMSTAELHGGRAVPAVRRSRPCVPQARTGAAHGIRRHR